jgi:hypothetical protein
MGCCNYNTNRKNFFRPHDGHIPILTAATLPPLLAEAAEPLGRANRQFFAASWALLVGHWIKLCLGSYYDTAMNAGT